MKIAGFNLPSLRRGTTKEKTIAAVPHNHGGMWHRILEPFSGAWQRNISHDINTTLSNHAVFACQSLIASDIAKLRVKLVEQNKSLIWEEVSNPAFSPVLRKPNHYQTRIQFYENWVLSKLTHGNAYILKERDSRNVVTRLYVLDPMRVQVLVADDGSVFYRLSADNLPGLEKAVMVPASEIIHDRFNCLFHPLVGISPLFANALSASQGTNIQSQSAMLFANHAQPGGILTAEGDIDDAAAADLKKQWQDAFSGEKAGAVAVLANGLTYQKLAVTAVEAQLIDQLKWTAEVVCSTYHVPPYKIGVGQMPTYDNIQSLNMEYYNTALQRLIEDIELLLDEGLGLTEVSGKVMGTEFDTDNLLRMDTKSLIESLEKGVKAAILAPNEARFKLNYGPTAGGDAPLAQQQNYSLAALAKRDAQADPFAKSGGNEPTPKVGADNDDATPAVEDDAVERSIRSLHRRARLAEKLGLSTLVLPQQAAKQLTYRDSAG